MYEPWVYKKGILRIFSSKLKHELIKQLQIKLFAISLSQILILNGFDVISAGLVKQEEEMEVIIDNGRRVTIDD